MLPMPKIGEAVELPNCAKIPPEAKTDVGVVVRRKLIRNLEVRVAVNLEVLFQCVYDYEIDKEMYVRRLERRYDAN